MGSEREAAYPVEDFGGVNLNSDSEDLAPNQLLAAQNLWEKTLGVLETRPGSETVLYQTDGIEEFNNLFKIYKSGGATSRFAAISSVPAVGTTTLPTGISVEFVTDTSGWWNKEHTFGAGYESGIILDQTHRRLVLRFVGYGYDKFYEIAIPSVTGYAAATAQKLRITSIGTFDNSRITGIEVYATVKCGSTETVAAITSASAYQEQTMWAGFMDLTTDNTQVKDFYYTPVGYNSTIAASTTIGSSERSFVARAYESGANNVSGTFEAGKTYYVAVLPQYVSFSTGSASRCVYRNPSVDVFGGEIVAITIPGATDGYIQLELINPNTTAFLVAIGETPQTLQPVAIFNDSEGVILSASTPPDVFFPGVVFIENPPQNNPGLIDINYVSSGLADISFRFSDFSRQDMLVGINDDGSKRPIFAGRIHRHVNHTQVWQDVLGNLSTYDSTKSEFAWNYYSANNMAQMQKFGDEARYNFVQWEDYCLFTNDYNPLSVSDKSSAPAIPHRTNTNYMICDGNVAGLVIADASFTAFSGLTTAGATATLLFSPATKYLIGAQVVVVSGTNFTVGTYVISSVVEGVSITMNANITSGVGADGVVKICLEAGSLPNFRYITKFDSSIVLGGGTPGIDAFTGQKNTSGKTPYFSRALNPFDFTIPGASTAVYQTISQDDDGEDITGFGIYTNTSTDQGPLSQLITAKKNCFWIINALPVADGGALGNVVSRILSKKVGGYHLTFVNTPIGTLVASYDNVYVMREDGEPTPIGQGISPLLKKANMARAVACYHDRHYKLAFSHPDYPGSSSGLRNNVEMWLNINKVIEKKGQEDWVGPMIGRAVDFCFVEDKDGDGTSYDEGRTRYAVDTRIGSTGRVYKADVFPAATDDTIYDFKILDGDTVDTVVTSTITTKDMDITQQDNNWLKLLKRFYVKLRTNWTGAVAATATHTVYADGVTTGTVNFGLSVGNRGGSVVSKPLDLVRLFPVGRIRGRTLRFEFTFTKRVAIGGLQVNYQTERRRV